MRLGRGAGGPQRGLTSRHGLRVMLALVQQPTALGQVHRWHRRGPGEGPGADGLLDVPQRGASIAPPQVEPGPALVQADQRPRLQLPGPDQRPGDGQSAAEFRDGLVRLLLLLERLGQVLVRLVAVRLHVDGISQVFHRLRQLPRHANPEGAAVDQHGVADLLVGAAPAPRGNRVRRPRTRSAARGRSPVTPAPRRSPGAGTDRRTGRHWHPESAPGAGSTPPENTGPRSAPAAAPAPPRSAPPPSSARRASAHPHRARSNRARRRAATTRPPRAPRGPLPRRRTGPGSGRTAGDTSGSAVRRLRPGEPPPPPALASPLAPAPRPGRATARNSR
jgi:hypothetical protein